MPTVWMFIGRSPIHKILLAQNPNRLCVNSESFSSNRYRHICLFKFHLYSPTSAASLSIRLYISCSCSSDNVLSFRLKFPSLIPISAAIFHSGIFLFLAYSLMASLRLLKSLNNFWLFRIDSFPELLLTLSKARAIIKSNKVVVVRYMNIITHHSLCAEKNIRFCSFFGILLICSHIEQKGDCSWKLNSKPCA